MSPSSASRRSPELMLATPSDDAFIDGTLGRESGAWWFERKHDGYRVAATSIDGVVRLRTRNGIDATKAYPEIAEALADQPYENFVVDGEIVVFDSDGNTNFELLQREAGLKEAGRGRRPGIHVRYVMFDMLALDAVDIRDISLERRRGLLVDAFDFTDPLLLSEVLDGEARTLLTEACVEGWEGLVAKRVSSVYKAGRSRHWYKLKCLKTDEMVIAGFTDPKGSRTAFGALVLGAFDRTQLVYTGRVGTGFDDATLRSLRAMLDPLVVDTSPFAAMPPGLGSVTWVRPELVCEVAFTEWTSAGQLRHPSFRGLRPDKTPNNIMRAGPGPTVEVSNGDKIFYPATRSTDAVSTDAVSTDAVSTDAVSIDAVTKAEVVDYYTAIADRMLIEVRNRPLVLERFPNGITGKGFYQKNTPDHMPDYIGRLPVGSRSRGQIVYPVVQAPIGLRYLANQAALVMHTLLSSADDPTHPIEVMFDLDPAGNDVDRVQKAARLLRASLEELGLAPRVKTSGSKGLHIHVDITDAPGSVSYEMSRAFAQRVAWDVVQQYPDDFTLEFSKKERKGRLLIDVLRNGHASHAAAAYSLRAVPEASLAAPLSWDEALDADFHPRQVTIRNIFDRLDAGIDPWRDRPVPTATIAQAATVLLG